MEERNVGNVEQRVRMVVGCLASLLGIVLLVPGEASPASGAAGTMLVIAGLYLFVTGSPGGPRENKTARRPIDGGNRNMIVVYRWAGGTGC